MATRLRRLANDRKSIQEAAVTLSLAFSDDPLIKWLRPGATSWAALEQGPMKWQRRQVQRYNREYAVFALESKPQLALTSDQAGLKEGCRQGDLCTIAMIEVPKLQRRTLVTRILHSLVLWLQDLLSPCRDTGGDEQRIEIMMHAHSKVLGEVRSQIKSSEIMYIEVVGVRPSCQGQGLGGKLMKAVIDQAEGIPIVLECTDRENIPFYERFGFEVVKEFKLEDPKCPAEHVVLFVMLRQ